MDELENIRKGNNAILLGKLEAARREAGLVVSNTVPGLPPPPEVQPVRLDRGVVIPQQKYKLNWMERDCASVRTVLLVCLSSPC